MRPEIAVVTGSSRGIGAAVARALAGDGFHVCVNFHSNPTAADAVVAAIVDAGGRAFSVQADVADEAAVRQLFQAIDRVDGHLGVLVNNAGALDKQMRVDEMTAGRVNRILATNVTGAFACCREAVRRMSTRHGGRGGVIVNVSSIAARTGAPGEYVDYAASKAAIDALTRGLALEVAGEGIRVNGVRPALIRTDIHAQGGMPDRVDRLKSGTPLGRGGEPDEVAAAVRWLVSDESSFVTGTNIDVSGGR